LKTQIILKETDRDINKELNQQLQATIDGLKMAEDGLINKEKSNNMTIQKLREDQQQLQANLDIKTNTEKANNLEIQMLREDKKQLQATIDELRKKVDEMSSMTKSVVGKLENVST
jgi:chromosome segregation ATPase